MLRVSPAASMFQSSLFLTTDFELYDQKSVQARRRSDHGLPCLVSIQATMQATFLQKVLSSANPIDYGQ